MAYAYKSPRPEVAFTNLTATPQTFVVNMDGMDTLILDVDLTRVAATALTFSFAATVGENRGTLKTTTVTDYAAKTISDGTFSYPMAVSGGRIFTFSLTGLGITTTSVGNLTVSIGATAGTTDSLFVTPIAARLAM